MDTIGFSSDIVLNEQQQKALGMLKEWWGDKKLRRKRFELSGAAGTGKTTLIRYFIKDINIKEEDVLFLAYVGKATLVMRMNGLNARTIHSAITVAREVPARDAYGNPIIENGRKMFDLKWIRKESLDENIKLIIVDEAGMVPDKLGHWLESYHIPIIVLGDLNQLPPVKSKSFYLNHPRIHLSQIMRQAKDSPIPWLAQKVVNNDYSDFKPGNVIGDTIYFKSADNIREEDFRYNDAIIVPYNRQRDNFNHYIRENIFGYKQPYPMIGDKLICRGNLWDKKIEDDIYLVNGMVGFVEDIDMDSITKQKMNLDFRPDFLKEGQCFKHLTIDRYYLDLDYQYKLTYRSKMAKMEYGYAITCHLAQGSQYDNTFVYLAEGCGRTDLYRRQWIYTAITRAVKTLTIIV